MRPITWKQKIGDRLIDYNADGSLKRDLIIINRKTGKRKHKDKKSSRGYVTNTVKYYQYHCNVCGWENEWTSEDSLCGKGKSGCACCTHVKIVKGINDIATTHPHLIQYFYNKNDAYTHSANSDFKPKLICPSCGYNHTNLSVYNMVKNGFACPICSDGISYGEKIISALLTQLRVVFLPQLSKKNYSWCKKYRYDFWFKYKEEEYIIETHGRQHYEENTMPFSNLLNTQLNDNIKQQLASKNGFDKQHYIIIDCRKSELDWIKQSIVDSELNRIFDLSIIDWNLCNINATNSSVKTISEYWERHRNTCIRTKDIAQIFQLDRSTIVKYLKLGNELNWCHYNAEDELLKNLSAAHKANQKKIVFLDKDMKLLAIFDSQLEAAEKSVSVLNETNPLNSKCISRTCRNNNNHWYRGYYILSYEQYKQQKEND